MPDNIPSFRPFLKIKRSQDNVNASKFSALNQSHLGNNEGVTLFAKVR